jgi:hypothetical protein
MPHFWENSDFLKSEMHKLAVRWVLLRGFDGKGLSLDSKGIARCAGLKGIRRA